MPFIGELRYERVKCKESFVGRSVFRLTEEFAYEINKPPKLDYKIICAEGFETDFASVPEWIRFIRPRNGKWIKASVIHDRACKLAAKKLLSYKVADTIFYYAMREDGASLFTAHFMYFWVRLNHLIVKD